MIVNASAFGQLTTFTAKITADLPGPGVTAGIPIGTVTFMDGSTILGTAMIDNQGVAAFSIAALSGGSHPITAVYNGDVSYSPSDSPAVDQVVNPPPLQNVYRLCSRSTHDHILTTSPAEYAALVRRKWTLEGIAFQDYASAVTIDGVTAEPLYRLVGRHGSRHTWTTSATEMQALIKSKAWKLDGVAGYVLPAPVSGSVPVYQLRTGAGNQHLITTNLDEYQVRQAKSAWIIQGIAGYVTSTNF